MNKVIDATYFRAPELEVYLCENSRNKIVLTDYACMETYKGNSASNITKSIEIISKYPNQVVILKGTREVVRLQLSEPYAAEDLIDQKQTSDFQIFCQTVTLSKKGDVTVRDQIKEKGRLALDHFTTLQKDAKKVAEAIIEIRQSFRDDDLSLIRRQDPLPRDVTDKIRYNILFIAASLFRDHPDTTGIPPAQLARKNLLFRFAISSYLLALRWISSGGIEGVGMQKLRNDLIDMTYIAYATIFDGLLSKDNKMIALHNETTFLLENVFI